MRLTSCSRALVPTIIFGLFIASKSFAVQAVTNAVGVIQKTALGESDTIISIPLKRPAVFNGVVDAYTPNLITAAGSPGWSADGWADGYYVFIRSGAVEGTYTMITGNGADTLNTADVVEVAQGDSFSIHSFWTLGTLFPGGDGLNASPSHLQRDSEIFIPNSGGEGINLAAEATYYFYDSAFRQVGAALDSTHDDTILYPDSYVILRNNIAGSTKVTFTGEVVMTDLSLPIMSIATGPQDNVVGLQRPIEMTLDESGLGASLSAGDQLLVWDDSMPRQNRLASNAIVYNWNGAAWSGGTNGGADQVFTPGRGVLIRRVEGVLEEVDWSNSPNYAN
ncbi:MAG: hypothetical protein CMI18_05770 [Opitutaceae bacterium]|nr:hypothetical protein [Opitutaceae bacterium]